jgi:hypothetical protein
LVVLQPAQSLKIRQSKRKNEQITADKQAMRNFKKTIEENN